MHQHWSAFMTAYLVWTLFGGVLLVRAYFVVVKKCGPIGTGDRSARAKEVQRQCRIVAMIWMATLPLVLMVYYLTRR